MKRHVLHFLVISAFGQMITAQVPHSLECSSQKEQLLKSKEVKDWQTAVLNYQKSKLHWLTYRKKRIRSDMHLDSYDYEWKTQRWREIQLQHAKDTLKTDSLRLVLAAKLKDLQEKMEQTGRLIPCKRTIADAMLQPVIDCMEVYMQNLRSNRYRK